MFGKFQETARPSDVQLTEFDTPERQSKFELPTLGELKEKLESVFSLSPKESTDVQSETPSEPPIGEKGANTATLDDGTVITIPDLTQKELATKTDDNGNVYMQGEKLQPNTTYELNGTIYTTDEQGRIISCDATPERTPENPRDNEAQRNAGGADRRPNDQGGHIVGRDMNGDGGAGNLVAMDSKINQSDYKRMENDIKAALDEGKDVTMHTDITYEGDSERPDKITATVTADGEKTVYKFDNNLDGSLMDEVPENGKEAVQAELDDTNGQISSIKETYDENGNLVETTVTVTYTGEDGTNYRSRVVIENS